MEQGVSSSRAVCKKEVHEHLAELLAAGPERGVSSRRRLGSTKRIPLNLPGIQGFSDE